MTLLAALVWMLLCTLAGATPNRWHRKIAYALMLVSLPILWSLASTHGLLYALLFIFIMIFQFRLLLAHWLKRGLTWIRTRNEPAR